MKPPMSRISCDRLWRGGGVHQLIRIVVHLFPARGQIIFSPVSPMAALSTSKSLQNDQPKAVMQCLGHVDEILEELGDARMLKSAISLPFFRKTNRYNRRIHIPGVVTGTTSASPVGHTLSVFCHNLSNRGCQLANLLFEHSYSILVRLLQLGSNCHQSKRAVN